MSDTRKPLELVIFERDEDGNYRDSGGWAYDEYDIDVHGQQKRLTEAELAAEMWRSYVINGDGEVPFDERLAEWSRVETWHRFATQPHHDEEQA